MNRIITILFALMLILIIGCKKSPTETSENHIVYSNSFESSQDTNGWKGYGSFQLISDVPVGGGNYSVRISGGCPIPHAFTEITIPSGVTNVTLRCWGKVLVNGGSIELYKIGNQSKRIQLEIMDTIWTFYSSPSRLACMPGDTLELAMNSGGDVYGAMVIDCIEIHSIQ